MPNDTEATGGSASFPFFSPAFLHLPSCFLSSCLHRHFHSSMYLSSSLFSSFDWINLHFLKSTFISCVISLPTNKSVSFMLHPDYPFCRQFPLIWFHFYRTQSDPCWWKVDLQVTRMADLSPLWGTSGVKSAWHGLHCDSPSVLGPYLPPALCFPFGRSISRQVGLFPCFICITINSSLPLKKNERNTSNTVNKKVKVF